MSSRFTSPLTAASSRRRWLAPMATLAAAAAVAAVFVTGTPAAAQQGASSQGAPSVTRGHNRYRATRAIVVDPATQRRRMPTVEELGQLVDTLSTLTKRPTEGLSEATLPNRAVAVDLDGGFGGVMLARANEDGTLETKCVFTFEEGAEFLGLVIDVQ